MTARCLWLLALAWAIFVGCSGENAAPPAPDAARVPTGARAAAALDPPQPLTYTSSARDPRTPDEIEQAACTGFDGSWRCANVKRRPTVRALLVPIQPISWTVSDWFVDSANSSGNANDSNSCTSSVSPCLTANQIILARWGTSSPLLPQNTTFHILSSQSVGAENIVLAPVMAGAFQFNVLGTLPTPVTLTPTGLTAKNRATPQQLQITVASAAGLAAGQLVIDTTRSSTSTVTNVGGTTITLAQPFTTLTGANASRSLTPAEDDGWTSTDSLSFYTLPTLNLVELNFSGPTSKTGAGAGILYMQYVSIPDPSGTAGTSVFAPRTPDGTFNFVDVAVAPQLSGTLVSPPSAASGIANAFTQRAVNLWAPGGVQFGGGWKLYGGQTPSFGSDGWNAIDGDAYVTSNLEVMNGLLNVEGICLTTGSAFARVWAPAAVRQLTSLVAGFVWGPGLITLDGGTWQNVAGTYATKALLTGGLRVDAANTTASSYNTSTGAWTSGITVTAANIDAAAGATLINPPTGGKFTSAL